VDDIIPIDFDNTASKLIEKERERYRLPTHVSATLNREIAVEKAKVMNAFASRQSLFAIITIAAVVISLYFVYQLNTQVKELTKTIGAINSKIDTMSNDLNILKSLYNPLPSPVNQTNQGGILIPI
jgi:hypothetical protein